MLKARRGREASQLATYLHLTHKRREILRERASIVVLPLGSCRRRGQCFCHDCLARHNPLLWNSYLSRLIFHISPSILFKTEGSDCGNFLLGSVYKLHITHTTLIEHLAFKCKDYVLDDVERPSAAD